MRIAHLIESDGPGGAERVLAEIATNLQASGAHNVVFLPQDGEGWLARQLDGSGVTIEHYRVERPVSPACARRLATAFRRHRVALAHSHEFTMAMYGAWAARAAAIPHVITMHGGRYYADRLRRRLALRAAIAVSARTIAVSARVASALSRDVWMALSRFTTIPNGVRFARIESSTVRGELSLRPADRLLVSVGNLYPVKGHEHLIDALALLRARHPAVHLALCGRGDRADALRARAAERGVSGRVHLLGLRPDVAAILSAADVFVLPSLSEGMPLALLEAMWAGRPIVASDVGDIGMALADGAGLLVEPGNPPALAEAIGRVLANADVARELGERAAARAAAEYGVAQMVGRYTAVYQRLLH